MNKKIIFSTGGTGGHILPAINLMKHFFEKGYEVLLVTDERGKKFISKKFEFKTYILTTSTFTNKNFFKIILSSLLIIYSIIKSIFILKKEKPNLIFGLGGYVSFPVSLASKFFNLPLIIYENNMILGRANKNLCRFSKKILVSKKNIESFPKKYLYKISEVGSIINKEIIDFSSQNRSYKNKSFSILILGGSQGAEIFGKIMPQVTKILIDKGYQIQIIQQCIDSQKAYLSDFYNKINVENYVFDFDKNILNLFLSSNLAITRCGASTTAELTQTLTPFIAIPLPNSVDNHQYLNAKYYENKGCCWIVEQNNFAVQNLSNLIIDVIENKNKLERASTNMKKISSKDVYNNIEDQVKNFI